MNKPYEESDQDRHQKRTLDQKNVTEKREETRHVEERGHKKKQDVEIKETSTSATGPAREGGLTSEEERRNETGREPAVDRDQDYNPDGERTSREP